MNTIAFGPQDPIITALGPLGTLSRMVWGFRAAGLWVSCFAKVGGRVAGSQGLGFRAPETGFRTGGLSIAEIHTPDPSCVDVLH